MAVANEEVYRLTKINEKLEYEKQKTELLVVELETGKMKKVIWIIDSGCSRYMTGDKALLSQFEEKAGPLVSFGDNSKKFTMGYGKIVSGNVVIDDVALVVGLEVNLLSVSQFAEKGFKVLFDKEECIFFNKKTNEVAQKGARKGSLFVTDLDSTNEDGICCFYTKASIEQNNLWHKKLSVTPPNPRSEDLVVTIKPQSKLTCLINK
ncbi:hypothetical protein AgCh_005596 [Apium graveolens]